MELEPITYQARGASFTGFLADGSTGTAAPGVLVIHEAGGLDDNAMLRTRMLGEQGFVAFAMDAFGERSADLARMREINRSLVADRALLRDRLTAAFSVLLDHPSVDRSKLSAIGYCFGGMAILELARSGAKVACLVGFHPGIGLLPRLPGDAPVRAKTLVCLGADDPVIGADQREAFVAEMTAAGADWQMILYGGVGHSFTNREIDSYCMTGFSYDADADRRSWQSMLDLFEESFGRRSAA